MRESRCMSLLPRTTLHSDSEQYIKYLLSAIYEKKKLKIDVSVVKVNYILSSAG
jgi:hypothetical protein